MSSGPLTAAAILSTVVLCPETTLLKWSFQRWAASLPARDCVLKFVAEVEGAGPHGSGEGDALFSLFCRIFSRRVA